MCLIILPRITLPISAPLPLAKKCVVKGATGKYVNMMKFYNEFHKVYPVLHLGIITQIVKQPTFQFTVHLECVNCKDKKY